VNLPNAITVGRIALTPLIAWLPFTTSWTARLIAFALFLVAAITDYWDGHIARQRNLVTDLGRLLDPLADKLLLVAHATADVLPAALSTFVSPEGSIPEASPFLFVTPIGRISLPLWIVLVVIGREAFMTLFRQVAARRGLVISAIGQPSGRRRSEHLGVVRRTSGSSRQRWRSAKAGSTRPRGACSPTRHGLVVCSR
jgi:phosphatidylglycerophosphate synthase